MTDDSIPIKRVSKTEMRKLFLEEQCLQKIATGELSSIVVKQRHSDPLKSGQEFCTYSQLVSIQDSQSEEIVRAHQYKKADGTLGASGKPDPVRMFIGGTIYKLEQREEISEENRRDSAEESRLDT